VLFPDLEEEYNYYRDRVLGYIREIIRFLDSIKDTIGKNASLKEYYDEMVAIIVKMKELLSKNCIENLTT